MNNRLKPLEPAPQADAAAVTLSQRWALCSLSLCMLMPSLDTSIANVALPTLAHVFSASFQQVQWIVLAYLLAITALIVSVGRLGDLIGRRRLLLGGISLFTLASLLCGVAPTLATLIAARAAQGLGAAMMMALSVAMVAQTVPQAMSGRAMGLLGTMSALGTTLGPTLGGILIAALGWRTIFLVNLPLGILNLLLVLRYLAPDRPAEKTALARFDIPGTLLLALTLLAYALAMTSGHGHFSWFNGMLLLVAVACCGWFVRVEARAAAPLLRLQMFSDTTLTAGLAMSVLVSTVMMATLVVGPFYLAGALGLNPAQAGLALSVGPLVAALTGVPAGRLVDRLGAQRMTMIGLSGMALGLLLLCLLSTRCGLVGYLLPLVLVTADYALFQVANNTAVMRDSPSEQRGVISGMLSLARNLGLISGAAVMGAIFSWVVASAEMSRAVPATVALGMRVTYAVAALLILLALLIAKGRRANQA